MQYDWRTYGPRRLVDVRWIEELPAAVRVRSGLLREVARLNELVVRGHWYDEPATAIPESELDDLRNDLQLWANPAAVLELLEHERGATLLGKKTREQAITALRQHLAK